MIYFCSQKNRRALVLAQVGTLNGIDFLEVAKTKKDCGRQLLVTMLKSVSGLDIGTDQVVVSGGTASGQVMVLSVNTSNDAPKLITVTLDEPGDFSTYTLSLVADATTSDPPDNIDPQLATVTFSFKAGCAAPADCLPCDCCPPNISPTPDINYLAKDFGGFRQAMLDRMSVLVPDWDQSHVSDIGMTMVEVLAYAADHLSYQQDAVGTEAYLNTARSRISLRRLARLVDYSIDPGSNARTWVHMEVAQGQTEAEIDAGTLLFPRVPGFPAVVAANSDKATTLLAGPLGFATMHKAHIHIEQNAMSFYTWSDNNCCLPNSATSATLLGTLATLKAGHVLIFEEVLGPKTGDIEDANPAHRWAVRLTLARTTDYKGRTLVDPLNGQAITQIAWADADALPFPLCISSTTDSPNGSRALTDVSLARGNIVPADHGVWQDWQDLGRVHKAPPAPVTGSSCACTCEDAAGAPLPRYYPKLQQASVTFAWPLDFVSNNGMESLPASTTPWKSLPASTFLAPVSSSAQRPAPQIHVRDNVQTVEWSVVDDLLSSTESDRACVLEIENNGAAFVRFGDGQYGMAPVEGMEFSAKYRVGNGSIGNIGLDTLAHIVGTFPNVASVRNPLAAAGGVDQETMEHISRSAPFAFRTQLRAVTQGDYGTMAAQDPAIQEARGTFRWTGSWYTTFVSVDSVAANGPDTTLVQDTTTRLNRLRRMGTDLEVEGAVLVGLRITMQICVDDDFIQADVRGAVMELFTTGNLCTGQRGLLDPANFTFGQTIYASPFIAAAQAVEGVDSVRLTVFERMDTPSTAGMQNGYLMMGRLEIARCDNDPDRLDLGVITLQADGGK